MVDKISLSIDGVSGSEYEIQRSPVQHSASSPAARAGTAVSVQALVGDIIRLARGTVYSFDGIYLEVATISDSPETGKYARLYIHQDGVDYEGRGSTGFEFDLGDRRWRINQIDMGTGTLRIESRPVAAIVTDEGLVIEAEEEDEDAATTSLMPLMPEDALTTVAARSQSPATALILEDIDDALELLHHQFPDSVVWIGQFDDEQECFRIVDARSNEGWNVFRGDEMPQSDSFCYWMAREDSPSLVNDVSESPYASLPLGDNLDIKSYVGIPLQSDGATIGSLCAASHHTDAYTYHDQETFSIIGRLIVRSLERLHREERLESLHMAMRSQALTDPQTGLPNRSAFLPQIQREWDRVRRAYPGGDAEGSWIVVFSVERRREEFARALQQACRTSDMAARLVDDEFAALLVDCISPEPFLRRLGDAFGAEQREVIVGAVGLHTAESAAVALDDAEAQLEAPEFDEVDLDD